MFKTAAAERVGRARYSSDDFLCPGYQEETKGGGGVTGRGEGRRAGGGGRGGLECKIKASIRHEIL